jgi:diguanylate cyclase (GGDEF)-like protein/PAS domain S-box-containing protein
MPDATLDRFRVSAGSTRRIAEGLSQCGIGYDYFRALVRELCETLHVDYAFVGEVVSEMRGRVLASWAKGKEGNLREFNMTHTPCREVLEEHYSCYPAGARHCFPEDTLFRVWSVESYAGVTLANADGETLGWLAVMDRGPLRDTNAVRAVLTHVAARTGAELVRERHVTALEKTLYETRERYELAARGSNDGLWDWHVASGALHVSDRWCALVEWRHTRAPHTAAEWFAVVHADDRERVEAEVDRHLRGETEAFECEFRIRRDVERWVLCRGAVTRDALGQPTRFAGSLTDITRRKRSESRLVWEATHDHLTGLANRALFLDRLEHAIALNKHQHAYDYAVLFFDLDRFKVVNDSLGHVAGDELLGEMARRVSSCLRPTDLVARLGGDEFTVLLEHIGGIGEATRIAERIFAEVGQPFSVSGQEVYTGASIGIAIGTTGYTRAEDVIRDADTAMYRAKANGRGRAEVFDTRMHHEAVERMRLEMDLRRAVDREELYVEYQPIVEMPSCVLHGFEALLRWRHPVRGVVPPSTFIPLAEETGLILPLGTHVLSRVCRQLHEWDAAGAPPLCVSVNVSVRQLADPDLVDRVAEIVRAEGVDPSRLRLEITESALMADAAGAQETFARIRALGIELCIDDFGTGYSSLSYLVNLPIGAMKIDRAFISKMDRDGEEMVRMIISLAHNLKLKVIAEGVETGDQFRRLESLSCDYAQGYLFARPLSCEAAGALIRTASP